MIDLNELQAAIDRCAFDGDVIGLSKADCVSVLSVLREAEKDAARYRWLKCKSSDDDMDVILYSLESREWDGFIDEAMKCK